MDTWLCTQTNRTKGNDTAKKKAFVALFFNTNAAYPGNDITTCYYSTGIRKHNVSKFRFLKNSQYDLKNGQVIFSVATNALDLVKPAKTLKVKRLSYKTISVSV